MLFEDKRNDNNQRFGIRASAAKLHFPNDPNPNDL